MKKNKKEKLVMMFHQVNTLMEENLEKWKNIEEIRKAYDEFVNHLKKFRDLQPDLEIDLSPVEEDWEQKRRVLISKTFPIGNILLVYAYDHGRKADPALGMSWETMKALKSKKLLKIAGSVNKKARKYSQNELESYGLTLTMIESLGEALRQCDHSNRMRSDLLTNRKKTLKKSDYHFKILRQLLDKRLDKLMTVFSGTHISFYQKYSEARSIHKQPSE